MSFTDNQTVFTILLVLHVFGAIAGIGPTFVFAILGPMAGTEKPPGGYHIMRAMLKIEKAMVIPTAYFLQPVTGLLLILSRSSLRANFWKEEWLIVSIVLYAIITWLSIPQNKDMHAMVAMMEAGQAETPEFGAKATALGKRGPIMTASTAIIAILMIWKPLSECAGGLLRC